MRPPVWVFHHYKIHFFLLSPEMWKALWAVTWHLLLNHLYWIHLIGREQFTFMFLWHWDTTPVWLTSAPCMYNPPPQIPLVRSEGIPTVFAFFPCVIFYQFDKSAKIIIFISIIRIHLEKNFVGFMICPGRCYWSIETIWGFTVIYLFINYKDVVVVNSQFSYVIFSSLSSLYN